MIILVTGGAGFIGSHLVRHLVRNYPDYTLVNLDALTYAADLSRLDDVNNAPNYQFVEGNINDSSVLAESGIRFDDPVLGIDWQVDNHKLSEKDKNLPFFKDLSP